MSDDDPPVVSRTPTKTLVAHAFGVTLRVKHRVQIAVLRFVAPLAVKLLIGAVAALGAAAWWRC